MNTLEQLRNELPRLTRSEQAIAEYIVKHPLDTIRLPLTDIAKNARASNTAIIRLCQKLGYKGFSEFKFALSRYALAETPLTEESFSPLTTITSQYIHFLNRMAAEVTMEEIESMAQRIISARRLVIMGYNRTGFSASQLSFRLSKMGVANYLITDKVVMNDYAEILGESDICIIFSITASTYKENARRLHENGCSLLLLTMTNKSPVSKYASQTILLPRISYSTEISFLDDQAIFFIFIEVLLSEIARGLSLGQSLQR